MAPELISSPHLPREGDLEFAVLESRVRQNVLELIEPTILRSTQHQLEIESLRTSVEKHTRMLQEITVVSLRAEQQIAMVDRFQVELANWDNQRRNQEGKVTEDICTMNHELNNFRYDLERKEASIHTMERTVDRLVGETNRIQELQASVQKYTEERLSAHTKLISRNRAELEAKQIALETRHSRLSDEVLCDETGLKKLKEDLRKTNGVVEALCSEMKTVKNTRATVSQLERVQEEVNEFLKEANSNVLMLNQSVEEAVHEVKEHFRTSSETVAAQNAAMMQEVQKGYQRDLKGSADLRSDLLRFMQDTQEAHRHLEAEVQQAHSATEGLVRDIKTEVDALDKKRNRDKANQDVDGRTLKKRLEVVCDNSDLILKGVENLAGVIRNLLESGRMAAALEAQDDVDRRKVALTGYKDKGGGGGPAGPGGRIGTPRGLRKAEAPVISVDNRCLSCSGHAGTVMAGFKIACLQYHPSPVEYESQICDRGMLLSRRQEILEHAASALHAFTQSWKPRKMSILPQKELKP